MSGCHLDARLRKSQSVPIIYLGDGWALSARTTPRVLCAAPNGSIMALDRLYLRFPVLRGPS